MRHSRQPGHAPVAFRVFYAMGSVAGRPRMWRTQAFTDGSAMSWEPFLGSLPGVPGRVVCELHQRQRGALRGHWPETEVYLCEWHLQRALERLFRNERRRNPWHAEAIDALAPGIERAFERSAPPTSRPSTHCRGRLRARSLPADVALTLAVCPLGDVRRTMPSGDQFAPSTSRSCATPVAR
jgi:hypothetical protein